MQQNKIEVCIQTKDSRPIRVHHKDGRSYIQSNEDSVYQIRVKNRTDERIKIVPIVDGLNTISGQIATDDPNETGYVLGAYEEQIIKGFRVSDDEVAQFKFVKKEASYATEHGNGAGNGVIAIRAYGEKETQQDKRDKMLKAYIDALEKNKKTKEIEYVPYPVYPSRPWYWDDYWDRPYRPYRYPEIWCGGYVETSTTDAHVKFDAVSRCTSNDIIGTVGLNACATNASVKGDVTSNVAHVVQSEVEPFDCGTQWGAALKDSVKEVAFEVGKLIEEVVVYYASVEGLKALGIDVTRTKAVVFPEAFKKTYCPKPANWTG
jgi:hypothetical protein